MYDCTLSGLFISGLFIGRDEGFNGISRGGLGERMQRELGFRELAGDPRNRNHAGREYLGSGVGAGDRFRVCRMRP